jgi:hypothetical protein
VLFSSWEDLYNKLETTDLNEVSRKMEQYNIDSKIELQDKWRSIFNKIFKNLPKEGRKMPSSFDKAMAELYGIDTSNNLCY